MFGSRLIFSLKALRERLWVRPLTYAAMAVGLIFLAQAADRLPDSLPLPDISADTIEKLLTVISASMLGVATFAVASMVSAYAAAGSSATPRAFSLVIADRVSQTALSSFIGAFIYSIVGIVAIRVGFYDIAGRFSIFLITLGIFSWVVLTFVRWVDNIARLGRLGNTIEKVEAATALAFRPWTGDRALGGVAVSDMPEAGTPVCPTTFGYIQHIDTDSLQSWAEAQDVKLDVRSVPGAFVSPARALLTVDWQGPVRDLEDADRECLVRAFVVGNKRTFDEDPRFGLIVLSEIASRALSPAVNDPGTAIDIINKLTHLLLDRDSAAHCEDAKAPRCSRIRVPALCPDDLLEDAFAATEKDGVNAVEVGIRLQKSYSLLARAHEADLRKAAERRSGLALQRAEQVLTFADDLARITRATRDGAGSLVEGKSADAED
ncbi:DUF2254 domain-containing protein [uncultured Maricaulis sp.]|uniref:DUF2254 domain-containing protein n=1 Tax=uncultured Maricaulis sp. TaxID=174710 RepID=UPI0030D76FD1|tara:strand:+ start:17940 stop:19244 length:1305 start_codon:yes stop_codon:yes gene_type:complete